MAGLYNWIRLRSSEVESQTRVYFVALICVAAFVGCGAGSGPMQSSANRPDRKPMFVVRQPNGVFLVPRLTPAQFPQIFVNRKEKPKTWR